MGLGHPWTATCIAEFWKREQECPAGKDCHVGQFCILKDIDGEIVPLLTFRGSMAWCRRALGSRTEGQYGVMNQLCGIYYERVGRWPKLVN